MNWIEALILGLLQGLTEFLPVSSSGHLEIGKALLGTDIDNSMTFTVVVHGATVLSTIIIFWKEILSLINGLFKFRWNTETKFITRLIISAIPVILIGLFFREYIELFFKGNLIFVGAMLIITSILLGLSHFAKEKDKEISNFDSIIIGIAQTIAVLPGISRSGATIATGLLLGNKKSEVAKFSFLMVLIPIIGANAKDILDGNMGGFDTVSSTALFTGFLSAFISGLFACKIMINLVKKSKLIYFSIYCLLIGLLAIIYVIFF